MSEIDKSIIEGLIYKKDGETCFYQSLDIYTDKKEAENILSLHTEGAIEELKKLGFNATDKQTSLYMNVYDIGWCAVIRFKLEKIKK